MAMNDRDNPMWLPEGLKPEIKDTGDIFFYEWRDPMVGTSNVRVCRCELPARQAAIIARNMMAGVPWYAASPIYTINRQVAAFCLANAETILSRVR